jgi:hypothetical protein
MLHGISLEPRICQPLSAQRLADEPRRARASGVGSIGGLGGGRFARQDVASVVELPAGRETRSSASPVAPVAVRVANFDFSRVAS